MFHDLHGLGLSIILKSQSHQIALSTSESSPNCMESILVLDASQNFKIYIGFLSLDIKSFFMLNLPYRPLCVNLLLLIFINIIIYFELLYLVLVHSPNHSICRLHKRFHFLSIRKTHEAPFSRKAFVRFAYICIHICNLFYQFRLNSASVRPGFFCSAQRMLHSLLKMSRLWPRKSCTHFVSEARLSAVGSVPSLVIQRI